MIQEQRATGLTAIQLEQLCHSEQIENTLHLLFALNHWAKARDRLFFVDRQGLYQVKVAILRQAYADGLIEAHAYINGKDGFGAELAFETAADIAAEGFLWRLEELADASLAREDDTYDRIVRQLYTRITGKETISVIDVESLNSPQAYEYILNCLHELENEARVTHQPIPIEELTKLCIAPSDLLYIHDNRYYSLGSWDDWDQLDESDLRKLDPEGLSLIAFHYTSPAAHYVFHLPFRLGEAFMPAWIVAQLKSAPRSSRESGEYYGRTVTETESLQQPVAEILRELGVDITAICPRRLEDKQQYMLAQTMRYVAWSEAEDLDEDKEELDEAFWQEIDTPASKKQARLANVHREPGACPLCCAVISASSELARIEHWHTEHPDQDLTVSQASWVLNRTIGKEDFYQQYPPDYRAPDMKEQGTRYWKTETLRLWLEKNEARENEK